MFALVFALPAVIAAVVPVRPRWLLAVGVVIFAVWLAVAASDSGSDELGALPTALIAMFLFLVWCAGIAVGRLLTRSVRSRR